MSTDKYQKSMLKVWDILIDAMPKKMSIAEIIRTAKIGRTAAFESLGRLEKMGIISVARKGNHSEVSLISSLQGLSLKLVNDSLRYKCLPADAKLAIGLFVDNLPTNIKAVFVFGSVLSGKSYNDIDIAVVYEGKAPHDAAMKARDIANVVSETPLNIHFIESEQIEEARGICVKGFEYYASLLRKKPKQSIALEEAIIWLQSASNNIHDKSLFPECLENAMRHLGFALAFFRSKAVNKTEAAEIFRKKYGKAYKAVGPQKLEMLEKAAAEIGKEIYR